jgi:outer membrane protein assembly factor BamA
MHAWFLIAVLIAGLDVQDYLGKTITDVRVEIAGVPSNEAGVLELIETRVGEPLGMRNVRGTIDHLVGLGRFEDVRVVAAPADQGVTLRWQLTPIRRITRVTVTGNAALSASAIRAEINDRFGVLPTTGRVNDMVTRLQAFYAERGFPRATILPRVQDDDEAPELSELVLTITAGERTTIGAAQVTGRSLDPEPEVLRVLGLAAGRPFDQVAIDERVAAYEESLRERGYYQARVRLSHVIAEDGRSASVTVAVEPGPHVSLVFAGDAMPDGNREGLVPIRAERAVDQDLLEDASLAIENALREQGYRNARAPYAREEKNGELVITFTVARGPLHRIGSVETTGNRMLSAADLAPLLQIKTGEPFVEARVGLVGAAITELYRVRGFTQVAVKPDIQVLPETQGAGGAYRPVAVRYEIAEGPQTIVAAVEFEGNTALAGGTLASQLGLQAGKPFYRPQLSVDRSSIERAYRNQGFEDVVVNSQLSFANQQQQVSLTWSIREGDQITVDRVLINGNARISTALIRRELTIQPGGPMSEDAMLESQRNLAELGLFRRVRITELPRTGSLTRDVLVDVEETDTTTIEYGGGVEVGRIAETGDDGFAIDELDFGPRGFMAFTRRNLWGKNRSMTLFGRVTLRREAEDPNDPESGKYGFNDYRGLFTFREPRVFGTTGDSQVTAFVEQGRRSSFSFNRRGVTADYARRLNAFTVTGRYTFDYTKLFDEQIAVEDQLLIDRLFPQVKLSKIFGGVIRDSRDDVLDPQKGAVVGVDGSVAARMLGSEVGFVKTFMQGFIYRRVPGRRIVVAAGARLGLAVGFAQPVPPPLEISRLRQGYGGQARLSQGDGGQARLRQGYGGQARLSQGDGGQAFQDGLQRDVDRAELFTTTIRELPASERFFAGGDTTVRGFALDRLGTDETLDPQGFPQGGNAMAIFNLETRAPYWKGLQFVWFLDAGNVYRRVSELRLDELRFSSGVGFRYRSPIGPLRVDWGWKLSTRLLAEGGRERSNVVHISLGQAF